MYIPKPPPPTSDSQAIVEWLEQELQALSRALEGDEEVVWFRPLAVEPQRPRDGQTAFANGVNWDPGAGAGLYSYWGGAWRLLFGSGGSGIVESVFGRTGAVVAVEADYSAFYSLLGHLHDDRYYTETEVDTALALKSDVGHTHDDRYYTEGEVDAFLADKSNVGHLHDDRYYTETEVDTALAGKSNIGHTHTLSEVTDAGAAAAAGVKNSIEIDLGDIQLVGDEAAPTADKYYGTDGTGVRGFYALPSGGGGAVDSVFGRTGAVVAETGDYDAFYARLSASNTFSMSQTIQSTGAVVAVLERTGASEQLSLQFKTATAGLDRYLGRNTVGSLVYGSSNNPTSNTPVSIGPPTTRVFTSSGTYTPPAGLQAVMVEVVGGGGGGRGSAASATGSGGGSGGYARKLIPASALGATETVTIGGGGAGGASGGNNGSTGSTSSFGAHCSANGGTGGTTSNGGLGGVAAGGDVNASGTAGIPANPTASGTGGGSFFSGGGSGRATSNPGEHGTVGGGGGGGTNNNAGGNGGSGIVVATEFY